MSILSRKGRTPALYSGSRSNGPGLIVLTATGSSGSTPPVDPLLSSLSEQGETQLTGDITLSEGAGITLTQVGQDIEVSFP